MCDDIVNKKITQSNEHMDLQIAVLSLAHRMAEVTPSQVIKPVASARKLLQVDRFGPQWLGMWCFS